MSIAAQITAHVKSGVLTPYRPLRTRLTPKRSLYLTKVGLRDLNDPQSAVNILAGRGFIVAALNRWTLNGRVWARQKRDRRIGGFMLRLTGPPPEIWEVRVTEPRPQVRIFARFAEPNTLIVNAMHTRNMLGKRGSAQWVSAMAASEKSWNELFPSDAPFTGTTIHDYVQEECDDFELD